MKKQLFLITLLTLVAGFFLTIPTVSADVMITQNDVFENIEMVGGHTNESLADLTLVDDTGDYVTFDRGDCATLVRLGFNYYCPTSNTGNGRPRGAQVSLTMKQWNCLLHAYALPLTIAKPATIPLALWNTVYACHNI
ncbi:hypothetical protein HO913_08335 [Streptococcus suis]|uniref:hypothetical protein n=1 Tax=Streptococcus parasuis TaxID=1501662 RepID=UPI001551FCBC|nr:hypothetical protein [Streptococcus parasuis]NQN52247.1 hypothetical protein [Streptococcus suis]MDG4478224.1 hypothetical protein [Streptococcus parasuis]NQP59315.1 hypothetical protein [Streptococcus suis]BCP60777.1 hypothetical protein SUT286_21030 [Streptococcus parasuis]HEM6271440.1 hypothetical protein [Streptococcus suis]